MPGWLWLSQTFSGPESMWQKSCKVEAHPGFTSIGSAVLLLKYTAASYFLCIALSKITGPLWDAYLRYSQPRLEQVGVGPRNIKNNSGPYMHRRFLILKLLFLLQSRKPENHGLGGSETSYSHARFFFQAIYTSCVIFFKHSLWHTGKQPKHTVQEVMTEMMLPFWDQVWCKLGLGQWFLQRKTGTSQTCQRLFFKVLTANHEQESTFLAEELCQKEIQIWKWNLSQPTRSSCGFCQRFGCPAWN